MNWINGTGNSCGAFDFTSKGLLNDALANGNYWRLKDASNKPAGTIGWWPAMSGSAKRKSLSGQPLKP